MMPRSSITRFVASPAALALAVILGLAPGSSAAGQSQIQFSSQWMFDADGAHPGGTIRGALRVRIQPGFHVHSDKPLDEFLIPTALSVTPPAGLTVTEIVYPEPIMVTAEFSEKPLPVFENDFVIGVAFEVADDAAPGSLTIDTRLRYQACDDKICLAPTDVDAVQAIEIKPASASLAALNADVFEGIAFTGERMDPAPVTVTDPVVAVVQSDCDVVAALADFTVIATAGGYLDESKFLAFVDDAESGVVRENLFEGKGVATIIALVILGGIALNLTPCVLPLIPINLAIIGAGAQAGSRARGFALGGTYGLAMAAVYGATGLVVILTAATFGAINSTIWFNVAIAILFVVLALAMFDIIHIDFSKFQSKFDVAGSARKGTFALAFGMGAIAALLAGACVAPVVIQVIVYSGDQYAKGTTIALALPFFLGIGMALPWPFAGAGLSCLPKPGMWMVRVKQAMGLFILGFAIYYGYLAWEIRQATHGSGRTDAVVAPIEHEGGWTGNICAALATAKAENKPVVIDMWATWCKNCLAMDKTTFKDEQVVERLDGYVKVKFQAEDLSATPAKEMLELFEGIGLPTYAILRPGGASE